jgi:hypothetical protein
MTIMKSIIKNIPGFFKWLIPGVLIAPILVILVTHFVQNKTINFSCQNVLKIIFITIGCCIIAFIWAMLLTIIQLKNHSKNPGGNIRKSTTANGKIILPYRSIAIGEYHKENLCVDILANIHLIKEVKPTSSQFLKRITNDSPYCPNCKKNLNILRGSWMIDGVQIGYKCNDCNTEIKICRKDLISEVKAEVRKNYDLYWENYNDEIKRITKGKPEKYAIPI